MESGLHTPEEYGWVQRIARETIAYIRGALRPGMPLAQVRALCEAHMLRLGADGFWYHGVGALVFAGDETAVSVSGRAYATSERVIAPEDIVTVDLSPSLGGLWGDFARTIILEDGRAIGPGQAARREDWRRGLRMEERLHGELLRFATPGTTFERLHAHMNAIIAREGFVNLDFHGNLGHSIAARLDARVYVERGNAATLGGAGLFTFEPHIGLPGSPFGYKLENVYYFRDGRLRAL